MQKIVCCDTFNCRHKSKKKANLYKITNLPQYTHVTHVYAQYHTFLIKCTVGNKTLQWKLHWKKVTQEIEKICIS